MSPIHRASIARRAVSVLLLVVSLTSCRGCVVLGRAGARIERSRSKASLTQEPPPEPELTHREQFAQRLGELAELLENDPAAAEDDLEGLLRDDQFTWLHERASASAVLGAR